PGTMQMATHPSGNGSGKFNVHQLDMGGWIRVFIDPMATVPEDLAVFLSHALTEWFRQRPHLRMRTVVPITRDGTPVETAFLVYRGGLPRPSSPAPRTRHSLRVALQPFSRSAGYLGVEKIMSAKFELGKVIIKADAACVLARAGPGRRFLPGQAC